MEEIVVLKDNLDIVMKFGLRKNQIKDYLLFREGKMLLGWDKKYKKAYFTDTKRRVYIDFFYIEYKEGNSLEDEIKTIVIKKIINRFLNEQSFLCIKNGELAEGITPPYRTKKV